MARITEPIDVEFELAKEGSDKLTYREIYPRGVIGNLYVSRIAAMFKWDGIPKRIQITIQPSNRQVPAELWYNRIDN